MPLGTLEATFARQSAMRGQPFEQSGIAGAFSSVQQGMSSMAIETMPSTPPSAIARG